MPAVNELNKFTSLGLLSGSATINLSTIGVIKRGTLTGNVTITFSAAKPGAYKLILTQDATGGRTLAFANISAVGVPPQANLGALAATTFDVIYDGTNFLIN